MSAPKPKIDDQFWFDYSGGMVKDSIDRLDKGIESVNKFTVSLLGVYTASSIFTVEYKELREWYWIMLFSLPYVVVLVARWWAASSTTARAVEFDPRMPADIQKSYEDVHDFKVRRLNWMIRVSAVATLLVGVTLILGFALGNQRLAQKEALANTNQEPYMLVERVEDQLLVTGQFPPEKPVALTIVYHLKDDTLSSTETHRLIGKQGLLFYEEVWKNEALGAEVKVEWPEKEQRRSIIKTLAPKKRVAGDKKK